jgi:hypothetical protein
MFLKEAILNWVVRQLGKQWANKILLVNYLYVMNKGIVKYRHVLFHNPKMYTPYHGRWNGLRSGLQAVIVVAGKAERAMQVL